MPIDYSHQHVSTSIMQVGSPHIPINPTGGSGVSVDNGTDPPAAVTTLSAPAAVITGDSATMGTAVISPTDPGAIGGGNLWLNSAAGTASLYPVFVRDPTNAFWIQASFGDKLSTDGVVNNRTVIVDADNNELAAFGLDVSAGHGTLTIKTSSAGGADPFSSLVVTPTGITLIGDRTAGDYASLSLGVGGPILSAPSGGQTLVNGDAIFNGGLIATSLPTSDPLVFGQLYSDGVPSAGVPKALMVSGG